MRKILVVDDESSIRKLLKVSLEANGYQIVEAATGNDGIQKIIEERPEVVLLDLSLPDRSGITVIKEVRQWSKIPIIILSVLDQDQNKIEALDGGADDYITKPFSVPELLVRIRVALRHASPAETSSLLKNGPLEIDLEAHTVKLSGQFIKLTATEFDILKVLLSHKGKVITHRFLLNEVWGPNSTEHVQYLRVYLGNLRKKLRTENQNQEMISTEAGVGYRMLELE